MCTNGGRSTQNKFAKPLVENGLAKQVRNQGGEGGILKTAFRKLRIGKTLSSQAFLLIGVATDRQSPLVVTDSHEWSE
jgi:hypothetical protein